MNNGATDAGVVKAGTGAMRVIGFGNVMRRDDGVGPAVAEAIGALGLGGVRVEVCHQLTPELAASLTGLTPVIFVDAADARGGNGSEEGSRDPGTARMRELSPATVAAGAGWSGHRLTPEILLALALELQGQCPRAWCVEVLVRDFGWGPGLSEDARTGVESAVEAIRVLWETEACMRQA